MSGHTQAGNNFFTGPKHRPRARLGKSGHEPLNARRPIVTPFPGPDKRDIAQRMARGAAEYDPGGAAAPFRDVAGAELGTTCGSLLHEVPPMGAVRQFSGVWHGKDFRSMFCRHQAPGGMGRTADSRDPHDLSPPRGGHTVLRPLPHEEVLMPTTRRIHRGESHWDTPSVPTRHAQDHRQPKRLRILRTVARRRSPGMVPAALALPHALPDEGEDAIGRQRERTERGRRPGTSPRLRVPLTRTHHPHGRPSVERGWHLRLASLAWALARIAPQRHQQPTEDQNVRCLGTVHMPLKWVAHLRYSAWDACATPQVSRSWALWDVSCIQHTQERVFFQIF
jgi:hypothetical protein